MQPTVEQLERDVDRRLAVLAGDLHAPALDEAVRERVRTAVRAEAARIGPTQGTPWARPLVGVRAWVGIAAAALLAIAIRMPLHSSPPADEIAPETPNAEALLENWLAAAADSSTAVSMLYEEAWVEGSDEGTDNDPLDNLENTFESLERTLGA